MGTRNLLASTAVIALMADISPARADAQGGAAPAAAKAHAPKKTKADFGLTNGTTPRLFVDIMSLATAPGMPVKAKVPIETMAWQLAAKGPVEVSVRRTASCA